MTELEKSFYFEKFDKIAKDLKLNNIKINDMVDIIDRVIVLINYDVFNNIEKIN